MFVKATSELEEEQTGGLLEPRELETEFLRRFLRARVLANVRTREMGAARLRGFGVSREDTKQLERNVKSVEAAAIISFANCDSSALANGC